MTAGCDPLHDEGRTYVDRLATATGQAVALEDLHPLNLQRHPDDRRLTSHIDEGFLQAERGELIDGAHSRREIQVLKDTWLRERSPKG